MFNPVHELPSHVTFVRQPDVGGHVHAADSSYVEWYWLPVVGPSAYLIWRRLNELLGDRNDLMLDTETLGSFVGLRMPMLCKAFTRMSMFGLGYFPMQESPTFLLRTTLPDLPLRHVERFSPKLRARFMFDQAELRRTRLVGVAALVPDDGVGGLEGPIADLASVDAVYDSDDLRYHRL